MPSDNFRTREKQIQYTYIHMRTFNTFHRCILHPHIHMCARSTYTQRDKIFIDLGCLETDAIIKCRVQVPVTVHCEESVKREKTNKMQQSDVCYQLLSQHVSGTIMPIFRRTKTVLLHMGYCCGSAGCGW
jgi:hypothetical protein